MEDISKEIRQLLKTERLIFGTEATLKALRMATIGKVFLSSNVPQLVREDILHYTKLQQGITIVEAVQANDELGVLCKKPFSISVIGVKKE